MSAASLLGPLLTLAGTMILAQDPLRWTALRITVERDGLHQVTRTDLEALVDPSSLPLDRLALFLDGQEVPLEIFGGRDGRLDRGDALVFYGRRRQGPHSHDNNYILGLTPNPRRLGRGPPSADPRAVDEGWRQVVVEEDLIFDPLASVNSELVRGQRGRHRWFWRRLAAPPTASLTSLPEECMATFLVDINPEPRRSLPARLEVVVRGPVVDGVPQRLAVNVNGDEAEPLSWESGLDRELQVRLPAGLLRRRNIIQLRNLSPVSTYAEPGNELGARRPNALLVDRLTLTVPTLLVGPGDPTEQMLYRIPRSDVPPGTPLAFRSLHRDGFLLYDVGRHTLNPNHTVLSGEAEDTEVCCAGASALFRPRDLALLRPTTAHHPGPGGDYLVITTSRFRGLLDPLLDHRRAQGLTPLVVEAREIYDGLNYGQFGPEAIARFVREAHRNWKIKPRFLLLVGDADHDTDWPSVQETLPATLVRTAYNGASATDAPYADIDGDGRSDLAVGRLPARTADDLMVMISRIIDLESRPRSGLWRRHLRFVAGEARFNAVVDALLENTLRNILQAEIPPAFRVGMTYANPRSVYFWPPAGFSDQVIRQLNEGCLAFVYVGHGSPRSFDSVSLGQQRFPILDASHVAKVDTQGRSPVLAIIACWTGEFDHPQQDSIAELLLARSGGPAAVIAASRISHPYPDALFGLGLARAFFGGEKRLGEILRLAQDTMLAESEGALGRLAKPFLSKALDPKVLVRDHLFLYNLLGDPAFLVPLPEARVHLEAAPRITAGTSLALRGSVEGGTGGILTLSLERPLGRRDPGLKPVAAAIRPEAELEVMETHRRANDPAVASHEIRLEDDAFAASLDLPSDLEAGNYFLTAYLMSPTGQDAVGALEVMVETR